MKFRSDLCVQVLPMGGISLDNTKVLRQQKFIKQVGNYSILGLKFFFVQTLSKSDGQEISTIEWQELKNEFSLFSDYKKLLSIEEIQCISFSSGAL